MQEISDMPRSFKEIRQSLRPFVNQAQEVTQIRRVLALHLGSHMNAKAEAPITHPLSLLDSECNLGSASSGIKGIRREYLRCVRANINAREGYEEFNKERHPHTNPESQDLKAGTRKGEHGSSTSLESFLEVVKSRRKHERLRILQDYVDMLAQKPAAASDYLDPRVVLKDVHSLPPVPPDVMTSSGLRQEPQRTDLNNLVDQLEKSVLRAKLLLKREQRLLSKVKAEGAPCNSSATSAGSRLQALGTARNELINWIETELAKAGESPGDSDNQDFKSTEKEGKEYIDSQLSLIQRKYSQYTKARQALIIAVSGSPETPAPTATEDDKETRTLKEEVEKTNAISHILQPYLEELTSVSNQQKSIIQQKSHLTISLAKQLKEAGQGLDRLAEESHLLPSYPLAGSQRKALETSFGDEISNHEKPDSARRARAWVHASELASKATKEAVTAKLEEGEVAILDARQTLLDLQGLLGDDINAGTESKNLSKDIWATLDGHLGVIKRDGVDEVLE
jgi:hypothetical protein